MSIIKPRSDLKIQITFFKKLVLIKIVVYISDNRLSLIANFEAGLNSIV